MDYQIRSGSGLAVSLPARNWIEAFGRALAVFGRDTSKITVLAIRRMDGRFYVEDSHGHIYMIQETVVMDVVAVPPRASATPAPIGRRTTSWVLPDVSPPPLDTPSPSVMRRAVQRVRDTTS